MESVTLGPMKKLIPLVLLVMLFCVPYSVPAHPGKTDRYGGHRCLKDCEQWKLYFKEYHLHYKDGTPIRGKKAGKSRSEMIGMPADTLIPVREPPATAPTATIYKYIQAYKQELLSFNPLLWAVLVLLLLLLILVLKRKKKADE